jgi:hypothetical protein
VLIPVQHILDGLVATVPAEAGVAVSLLHEGDELLLTPSTQHVSVR